MIEEFVNRWEQNKHLLEAHITQGHPKNYEELLRWMLERLFPDRENYVPDPARIYCIDDGDYQGTLVFVIGATGYQPSKYWYTKVGYGSCSGCDTFEAIRDYRDGEPSVQQVEDYMQLALYMLQQMKEME